MDDSYLTTSEVLEYLQVNLRTVYRLLKAGKIPAVRVGRQWRFRRADLDLWLDLQRGGARPADGSAPQAGREAPAARAGRRPAPARVLVVDDEASIRELLTRALALAEYDVEAVADGESAIACLRTGRCDLLMTDLRMPGIDGLTLIREARRLHPSLPVVIITGFSSEASAIEAIDLGVTGYLTKPFRVPKVLAVAAKALGE
jgi:excisionase family DNA binding protein